MQNNENSENASSAVWIGGGITLVLFAIGLRLISFSFGYEIDAEDYPIALFISGYMAAGLAYLWVLSWLLQTPSGPLGRVSGRWLILWAIFVGLLMRLAMFGAEPVLENDFYRYLWDGALSANGLNPYRLAPQAITDGFAGGPEVRALAAQGATVLERINHSHLSTIYPATAQAMFALAHLIEPFSLEAWRIVLLGLEICTLAMILLILRAVEKPLIFSVIYWWNPVVVKEIMNSAHMEPVLILPLLVAVWMAIRFRFVSSAVPLALAIAAKIWPVILMPALYKPLLQQPVRLVMTGLLILVVLAISSIPILTAGLGETSGFVAYAKGWQASSALIHVFDAAGQFVRQSLGIGEDLQRPITRLIIIVILGGCILYFFRRQGTGGGAILKTTFAITATLYLLSPTQFPWYFIWIAPFLTIYPIRGFLLITALAPIHYAYFIWLLQDRPEMHKWLDVWIMWVPVWLLLIYDYWKSRLHSPGKYHA